MSLIADLTGFSWIGSDEQMLCCSQLFCFSRTLYAVRIRRVLPLTRSGLQIRWTIIGRFTLFRRVIFFRSAWLQFAQWATLKFAGMCIRSYHPSTSSIFQVIIRKRLQNKISSCSSMPNYCRAITNQSYLDGISSSIVSRNCALGWTGKSR